MQSPANLDQTQVVNALRGPQPVQLAGDVVQLPYIPHKTAGPATITLEEQLKNVKPYLSMNPSETNLRGVPYSTMMKWLNSPASAGRVGTLPPTTGPYGGGGGGRGNLPPGL